ncbi:polyprenyl synthetase family protein [Paenibacillus lemnae]|uniref:Polyprenyl synthetase family protein n=1 Tax=Paenibacillus lemnae TaxID=1330551 RepID=A0A848M6W6_PAELE|nr:polyprenyl synthetase family protein [Paenibacillus lemnae]NMO95822.1 polyprenyl synthetase family protein [Paenibacillus lemnae]
MINENKQGAEDGYKHAEQKAARYLEQLQTQIDQQEYAKTLIADFTLWGKKHKRSAFSFFAGKRNQPGSGDISTYLQWLQYKGRLDDYLKRSVTYMYMRDLGFSLDSVQTEKRIQEMSDRLRGRIISTAQPHGQSGKSDWFSLTDVYRWAQKEHVESAVIWVIGKLKDTASHIPQGMDPENAQRKLIKIILGVVLHVLEEVQENTSPEERSRRLDEAIRLGYSYGLTYPFIDDLLDSDVLNAHEQQQYSNMIRSALLTGVVPKPGEWANHQKELLTYVYQELKQAFEYIHSVQRRETDALFFEQAFIFFHAQEEDRAKNLENSEYTNEELYIPIILKSAASRSIVRSVIAADYDEGYDQRTFYYGLYNQLADDFADMFDDMEKGAVTPYTYYMQHHQQRPDLINPFELYWAVIHHLIHHVYHGHSAAQEVILDRAVNGLKRFRERLGAKQYTEIMERLVLQNSSLMTLLQNMVLRADHVDFFDKLLRDQMVESLRSNRTEQEQFHQTVREVREQIKHGLSIEKMADMPSMKQTLIDAANYSLQGDSKLIRPIIAYVMGVEEYGLDGKDIFPLLRSLEYMHTASLIFDDLPSQDNASVRRGRSTLHQIHNSATAELTGLYLIQKAMEEQASLAGFDPLRVQSLMKYSSQRAGDMCAGQAMDLHSRGRKLTLDELNMVCFYKTGIAFEASLVMPAILAGAGVEDIEVLKQFAYHMGIAFQIKDDLLDAKGDPQLLGKPTGMDTSNDNSTFVTILGYEGAEQALWEHYCDAIEMLQHQPRNSSFLHHLLSYIVTRDR